VAKLVNELTKLQKRAAILISGAFKRISTAALDIDLFVSRQVRSNEVHSTRNTKLERRKKENRRDARKPV
jgi:hypothetical protein